MISSISKLCKPRPQSDLTEYILYFTVTFSWSENSYLLACRTFINWEEAVVSSKNVLDEITKRWFSKWESAPSTMRETWILESLSWDNLQCRKSSTCKLFFIWLRSKQSPSTWSTIALKLSLYEEQIKLYISLPVLELQHDIRLSVAASHMQRKVPISQKKEVNLTALCKNSLHILFE